VSLNSGYPNKIFLKNLFNRYGRPQEIIRKVCGEEIAAKIPRIWGLDEEGELNAVWRPTGQEGLWITMG
jgi:hypothetical protein